MVAESNARNVPPALAWHQTSGGEGPRRAEEQRLSPRRTWDNMNTFIDSSVTSHDTPDRITQRNHMTHTAPYSRTTLRRKHAGNSSGGVPCDTPPAFSRRTGLGKRSPRENKPWYFFCATILNFPLFHSPAIYCFSFSLCYIHVAALDHTENQTSASFSDSLRSSGKEKYLNIPTTLHTESPHSPHSRIHISRHSPLQLHVGAPLHHLLPSPFHDLYHAASPAAVVAVAAARKPQRLTCLLTASRLSSLALSAVASPRHRCRERRETQRRGVRVRTLFFSLEVELNSRQTHRRVRIR